MCYVVTGLCLGAGGTGLGTGFTLGTALFGGINRFSHAARQSGHYITYTLRKVHAAAAFLGIFRTELLRYFFEKSSELIFKIQNY